MWVHVFHRLVAVVVAGVAGVVCLAADPSPDVLLSENTHAFEFNEGALTGDGAKALAAATADAQFVLIGEDHHDHDTPLFALALFQHLHREGGFNYVDVEQDGLGVDEILKPGRRGDAAAIGKLMRTYPFLLGFGSDQDIEFLEGVMRSSTAAKPIYGLEQTQCAALYLEELQSLAPNDALRAKIGDLLAEVRAKESSRTSPLAFIAAGDSTVAKLEALHAVFGARAGTRADFLLTSLVRSAQIYAHYRHGAAENSASAYLLNNTVREAWLKERFAAAYREQSAKTALPKVLFKFGGFHMYHGRGPSGAFTLGNLAHELAIFHGHHAVGLFVLPVGGYAAASWKDLPAWMLPLVPREAPHAPLLVALEPLRAYARGYGAHLQPKDQNELSMLLYGYDFLVLLPHSRKADWHYTGFAPPE